MAKPNANQPQVSPSEPTYKPLCRDAWCIPPSNLMIKHGNDYYTCSKCGEPCEVVDLKAKVSEPEQAGLRTAMGEVLDELGSTVRMMAYQEDTTGETSSAFTDAEDELMQLIEATCMEVINQSHTIYLTKDDNGVVDMQDDVVAHWEQLRVLQRQALSKLLGRGEDV